MIYMAEVLKYYLYLKQDTCMSLVYRISMINDGSKRHCTARGYRPVQTCPQYRVLNRISKRGTQNCYDKKQDFRCVVYVCIFDCTCYLQNN